MAVDRVKWEFAVMKVYHDSLSEVLIFSEKNWKKTKNNINTVSDMISRRPYLALLKNLWSKNLALSVNIYIIVLLVVYI